MSRIKWIHHKNKTVTTKNVHKTKHKLPVVTDIYFNTRTDSRFTTGTYIGWPWNGATDTASIPSVCLLPFTTGGALSLTGTADAEYYPGFWYHYVRSDGNQISELYVARLGLYSNGNVARYDPVRRVWW